MDIPSEIEQYYAQWKHIWDSAHEYAFLERSFVENVFCPALTIAELANLKPQFKFKDLDGKNRRMDFVMLIDGKKLAIEVDGLEKLKDERGNLNRKEFDDFLFRQNSILEYVDDFIRFSHSHIFDEPQKTQQILAQRVEKHRKNEVTREEVIEIIQQENEKLKNEIVLYQNGNNNPTEIVKVDRDIVDNSKVHNVDVQPNTKKQKEKQNSPPIQIGPRTYKRMIVLSCSILSVLILSYWLYGNLRSRATEGKPDTPIRTQSVTQVLPMPTIHILGFAGLPAEELESFTTFIRSEFGASFNLICTTDSADNGKVLTVKDVQPSDLVPLTNMSKCRWTSIGHVLKSVASQCALLPDTTKFNIVMIGEIPNVPKAIERQSTKLQGLFMDSTDWNIFKQKPNLKFFIYNGKAHKPTEIEKEFIVGFDKFNIRHEVIR